MERDRSRHRDECEVPGQPARQDLPAASGASAAWQRHGRAPGAGAATPVQRRYGGDRAADGVGGRSAGGGGPVAAGSRVVQRQKTRARFIDASRLPQPVPDDIELPTVADPPVSVVDRDVGDCRQAARSEVIESLWFVDNGLAFVDPRGDPWTLSVDALVFTNVLGKTIEVPWDDIRFGAAPRATSFEQAGGILYPLGELGERTFDGENTPGVVAAARLVFEVIAELKAQRVEYAELTSIFAASIASLGAAHTLVRAYTQSTPRVPARRGSRPAPAPADTAAPAGKGRKLALPEGGVRRPASRHRAASVKQGTRVKENNTVYDRSVDIGADVRAINAGEGTLGRNSVGELTVTVNGRTYAVESNGTLSPRTGPGFTTLSRDGFRSLGMYNELGNTETTRHILNRMGVAEPDRAAALEVWKRLQ